MRPRTKQIASRMLDLPEPFSPVMALKDESHPEIWVRTGYDLKPSNPFSYIPLIFRVHTIDNEFLNPHGVVEKGKRQGPRPSLRGHGWLNKDPDHRQRVIST